MASIFQRLFKVVQSEAHSAVDQFEDPIKLTEQGIRDLKQSLAEAMQSLAQVKGLAIRLKKDIDDQKSMASDYERKAMLLLKRMQSGDMEQGEAEQLASAALEKKQEAEQRVTTIQTDYETQQKAADQLQTKVEKLKRDIGRYENELVTLRARSRTADSMKKINQQLAGADSSGTIAMLEKMKERVNEQESLAEAYGDMADASASLDDKIDKALDAPAPSAASDSLAELKKKMGIEA